MPTRSKPKTLRGRLEHLLFSPKGGVEGLLVTVRDKPLQVSMEPATADPVTLARAVGQSIEVTAVPDHSPKTREAAHQVFKLSSITKVAGKAVKSNGQ
jgi:hypothetical protein